MGRSQSYGRTGTVGFLQLKRTEHRFQVRTGGREGSDRKDTLQVDFPASSGKGKGKGTTIPGASTVAVSGKRIHHSNDRAGHEPELLEQFASLLGLTTGVNRVQMLIGLENDQRHLAFLARVVQFALLDNPQPSAACSSCARGAFARPIRDRVRQQGGGRARLFHAPAKV